MASPSTVLSLGFGSWGSVNLLPTLGFGVGTVAVPTMVVCLHGDDYWVVPLDGVDREVIGLAGENYLVVELAGWVGGCDMPDAVIEDPSVWVADNQDVVFGINFPPDVTWVAGTPLLLTIKEDPDWPRRIPESRLIDDIIHAGENPQDWTTVLTSTTLASPVPTGFDTGVVVARAVMALLEPGRNRYYLRVDRTDSGNYSPVVWPVWLSVGA